MTFLKKLSGSYTTKDRNRSIYDRRKETQMNEDEQKAKDLAISSLAISIACIPMTLGFLSFAGSIVGHIALGKLDKVQNQTHRGFAIAGIIIGWVASALSLIGVVIFLVIVAGIFASSY